MIKQIDARIQRALGSIRQAFRGVLTLVKSGGAVQLVQLDGLAGEQLQDAELFQHYGYTSNPPAGTMAIVLPIGGKTAHGIIVATEHGSYRLQNLQSGEVAIYTDEGDSIVLKRGRLIEATTQTFTLNAGVAINLNAPTITANASTEVALNTPVVAASTDVKAQGEVIDHGNKSMSSMRDVYNGHTHTDPQGGSVSAPNGIM
ncbi:hypothetical protein CAP31_03910 [Sulfuriferula sp. AH1]|uniref:phage baseplate assembly protein V n=1 Tax=Sulfuriferula sp. AH1 TaxID=1985873 RepID=UPI000B3B0D3F|nr:phage baseplate assembly protein V [Sulfuriferula sp. AH1]ARU30906.1 hypothetical protein CAP31_03910 [Sulfuriferula sp. AH1]